MDQLHPPAIVRKAADLRLLAAEIRTAITAGEKCRRAGLEHYRAAGLKLRQVKEQLGHGKWLRFLKDHIGRSERQVRRWILLAKSDAASDLEEAWRAICGHGTGTDDEDEPETQPEPAAQPPSGKPPGPDNESGDQEQGEEPSQPDELPSPSDPVPERFLPILGSANLFEAAAKAATRAAQAVRAAEDSPAYKALEKFELQVRNGRNLTQRMHSGDWHTTACHMARIKPATLCPECRGIEASPDAELCAVCGGKGFLIADEVGDA